MTLRQLSACVAALAPATVGLVTLAETLTVSGPYSHDNVAVYLIHGPSDDDREYLTLDEGLTAGLVFVREKGSRGGADRAEVNSLEIENKSGKWLFLQAGDIVKGGKQDRTIMTDLTVPPGAPPAAIDAFCVERGRWTATGGPQFGKNTGLVSGVGLKRAIQGEKNQARVWEEVAKADARATDAARAGGHVMPASATTLSGTGTYNAIVENPTLKGSREQIVAALIGEIEKARTATGMAVAINGQIVAADVYASAPLFRKLARKLLDSYATEAVLAPKGASSDKLPGQQAVVAFLASAANGSSKVETIGGSMHQRTVEGSTTVLYEYGYTNSDQTAKAAPAKLVHRSYLKKL
jgi:hypothetical protein